MVREGSGRCTLTPDAGAASAGAGAGGVELSSPLSPAGEGKSSSSLPHPPLLPGDAVAIVVVGEGDRCGMTDATSPAGVGGDRQIARGDGSRGRRMVHLCRLSPRGFRRFRDDDDGSKRRSILLLRYDDSTFLSLVEEGNDSDDHRRGREEEDGVRDIVELERRLLERHLGDDVELVYRTPRPSRPGGVMAVGGARFISKPMFEPAHPEEDVFVAAEVEERRGIVVVHAHDCDDDESSSSFEGGDDEDNDGISGANANDMERRPRVNVRVYRITGKPRPLASVTLSRIRRRSQRSEKQQLQKEGRRRRKVLAGRDARGDESASAAPRVMASSCTKSCLAGRVVAMGATVRVVDPLGSIGPDDEPSSSPSSEYYEVTRLLPTASAAATRNSPRRSGGDEGVFLILPSTRITLLDDNVVHPKRTRDCLPTVTDDDDDGGGDFSTVAQDRPPEHRPRGNFPNTGTNSGVVGAAANVILDTLRAVGEASKLRRRRGGGGRAFHPSADVPRALLLTGPPGVGKTHAVRTAVRIYRGGDPGRVHLTSVRGSELLGTSGSGHPSDAMMELRRLFASAAEAAAAVSPASNSAFDDEDHVGDVGGGGLSLVFLDECDALVSSSPFVEAQLAILLDRVASSTSSYSYGGDEAVGSMTNEGDEGWRRVVVVAATNRVDAVPRWLRRPGRLDREVAVSPPNVEERLDILRSLMSNIPSDLEHDVWDEIEEGSVDQVTVAPKEAENLADVAEACVGYVAADLSALVRRATMMATAATCHDQEPGIRGGTVNVKWLKMAMQEVGASALRDAALSAPPRTRWNDIAGDCGGAKMTLRRAVEWPRTKKESFARLGLTPPRGILLHGPPGCAKTTLAKAAAGASGVAFLSLAPADVYSSSYVGEAEAVVRRAFNLARSAAPCILFFDEIDAVLGTELSGSSRTSNHGMNRNGRGSSAEARVLSTFLNEMDGVDSSSGDGVLVLGATNRPFVLDAALLRPGRFDKCIFVPPPDVHARRSILSQQTKRWEGMASCSQGPPQMFDVDALAEDNFTGSMTGAEIVGACREAAMLALREAMQQRAEDHQDLSRFPHHYERDLFPRVSQRHLEQSLKGVAPLLRNARILREYDAFEAKQGFH